MSINKRLIETKSTAVQEAKFAVTTWTGNATTGSATRDINVGFAPDIYWIRGRDFATSVILDRVRGSGKGITTYNTNAEDTGRSEVLQNTGIQLVGTSVNYNGEKAVMWSWGGGTTEETNTNGSITSTVRANTNAGYSIVKFTSASSGSSYTVGHGLSSTPELIIFKYRNLTSNWPVYVAAAGGNNFLYLDLPNAVSTGTNNFMTSVSSSTMTFGSDSIGGYPLVAYCFHSVAGYSKIGSYTGDGTTTKTITTGFQPDFVMIKVTSQADNWVILDSVRGGSINVKPNSSASEATEPGTNVSFTSTGFQLIGSGAGLGQTNGSGKSYIYMAFKIT